MRTHTQPASIEAIKSKRHNDVLFRERFEEAVGRNFRMSEGQNARAVFRLLRTQEFESRGRELARERLR